MTKIIGNTTATPNPNPDWEQTDSTKADYIKNKPTILTEEDIIDLIEENGGGTGGGENVQSDWNQNDESAPDYIKNKPDKDKWVLHEEYKDTNYWFQNNNDGTWYAGLSTIAFYNLRVGEKYRVITDVATMEFIIPNDKTGYYELYSEDGKTNLLLAGFYGYFNPETDEQITDDSIFTGTLNLSYHSSVGEAINGKPMDEIPWEAGYYAYNGTVYSEYYEPQKIGHRYLPDDIVTKDMIPNNIESVDNRVVDIYNNINDDTYPTSMAVYNFGYAISLDAANQAKQELIDFQITPLSNRVGDIETALDNIIDIQNTLIGGDNV